MNFSEKHRQVLNQALRQNSNVLSAGGPFAILTKYPKLLDFDVKRKYFRKELSKLETRLVIFSKTTWRFSNQVTQICKRRLDWTFIESFLENRHFWEMLIFSATAATTSRCRCVVRRCSRTRSASCAESRLPTGRIGSTSSSKVSIYWFIKRVRLWNKQRYMKILISSLKYFQLSKLVKKIRRNIRIFLIS